MKTNDYISSGTFAKLGSSKANIFVAQYKTVKTNYIFGKKMKTLLRGHFFRPR